MCVTNGVPKGREGAVGVVSMLSLDRLRWVKVCWNRQFCLKREEKSTLGVVNHRYGTGDFVK